MDFLNIYHIAGDKAMVGEARSPPCNLLVDPCAPLNPDTLSQQKDVVQAGHSTEAIIPHFIERMREICDLICFFPH
jgi:hypothetical protein